MVFQKKQQAWNRLILNEEKIIRLYSVDNISTNRIANIFNCSQPVISRILKKRNVELKPAGYFSRGRESWNKGLKLKSLSEEHRRKISEGNKGKKIPEEVRKKMSNSQKGKIFSKEHRERISLSKKGIKLLEETKKKMSLVRKGKIHSGTFRNGQVPWNKGLTKKSDERWKEICKRISKSSIGRRLSKETKLKISRLHKGRKYSKEHNLKISKTRKRLFAEGKINILIRKPNNPEKIMIDLIQKNNLPFNYVGDGKIWFRGENHSFNPDFLSKNPKHIIEVFGDYWHNLLKVKKRDTERLRAYSKYGYKTLIIWEHELVSNKYGNKLQEQEIINKIKEFIK